jgi:hypothetical protein
MTYRKCNYFSIGFYLLSSDLFFLYLTQLLFILFGLKFHHARFASGHCKIFFISALILRQSLDYIIDVSLSANVQFDMSKISLVKKFYHSVSNVSLISFYLPHISNYYRLKILTDSSEIGVS